MSASFPPRPAPFSPTPTSRTPEPAESAARHAQKPRTPRETAPPGLPPFAETVGQLRAAGCVFAEEEAQLLREAVESGEELALLVERRAGGAPLEYVLGWAEFDGARVAVVEGVFVPRRRTEFLVSQAAANTRDGACVVDLCCGTGALGLALACRHPGVRLDAADADPVAVACARGNLAGLGEVHHGDLFAALPERLGGRIDTLLCNVPYVPTDELPLLPAEAREHEHRTALDGGADGLDVLRRVLAEAAEWLAPGGRLFFETSERQAAEALAAVTAVGCTARIAHDEERAATVVVATAPGGAQG